MKKKTGLQIKLNLYKLNYKLTETMAEMQKKQLKAETVHACRKPKR